MSKVFVIQDSMGSISKKGFTNKNVAEIICDFYGNNSIKELSPGFTVDKKTNIFYAIETEKYHVEGDSGCTTNTFLDFYPSIAKLKSDLDIWIYYANNQKQAPAHDCLSLELENGDRKAVLSIAEVEVCIMGLEEYQIELECDVVDLYC